MYKRQGHLNEGKTTLAACIPLEGQRAVGHFTELGKQFDHIFLLSAEGKVADKNAHVLRGPGTKQWTDEALNIAIGPLLRNEVTYLWLIKRRPVYG